MDFKALFEFQVIGDVVREIEKIKSSLKGMAEPIEEINRKTRSLTDSFKKVSDTVKELGEKIEKSFSKVKDVSRDLAELGASITAPLAGAVYSAVDYEKVLIGEFNKVADLGKKELSEFSEFFKELSEEYAMTPQDIARISAGLAQMGIPIENLKEYTKIVSEMAFAFDMTAEGAGELVGKIASAFGIKENVKQVKELGDVINYLSNTLGAKASDILYALREFAGTAKSFGITSKEASVLAGVLIDMGETAETAGTALKTILAKMTPTEKAFRELIRSIGITREEFLALKEEDPSKAILLVLERLKKFSEYNPEKVNALINKAFGLEQAERVKKLMNNIDKLKEKLSEIEAGKALGSMASEVEKLRQTTWFEFQKLKTQLVRLSIDIGSLLIPPVRKLVEFLEGVLKPLTLWVDENKELVGTLLTVAGAVGLGLTILGTLGWYIGFVASGIGTLIGVLGTLTGLLPYVITLIRGLGIALRLLALNPVGIFLTALAGVAYLIYRNWKSLLGLFEKVKNAVKGAISSILSTLKAFAGFILSYNPFALLYRAIMRGIEKLKTVNLFEVGKNIVESLKKGILSTVKAPVEAIQKLSSSILSKVKGFFGIRSPSRVFMDIGKHLNLGLFEGIKNSASILTKALKVFKNLIPENLKTSIELIPSIPQIKEFSSLLKLVPQFALPKSFTAQLKLVPSIPKIESLTLHSVKPNIPNLKPSIVSVKEITKKESVIRNYIRREKERVERAISGTFNFNVVVNVHLQGKTAPEIAQSVGSELEKEIRRILERIERERIRRRT